MDCVEKLIRSQPQSGRRQCRTACKPPTLALDDLVAEDDMVQARRILVAYGQQIGNSLKKARATA